MKLLEKKIKHHYVWAHYLEDWTVDGTNIYYITKKSNIASDSVRGLGLEKDFYKMGILKESDKELIALFTNKSNETLKELHWHFVNKIFEIQKMASALSPSIDLKFGINLQDIIQSNTFENYLSEQESNAIKILSELKKGNLLSLNDKEKYYNFCYFLGHQFSRTQKMKQLFILSLDKIPTQTHIRDRLRDFYNRNWWFMCSFMATNISYDMSLNSSRKVILLENKSNMDFITSDQPVINLNSEGSEGEFVDYYYPLSTSKALLINTSGVKYFPSHHLSDDEVHILNVKVARASCKTIFSRNKETIKLYKKDFNKRDYLDFTLSTTD
ncbi:DUF4238 domain-containing protein [Pantoea vagans]|uniref:DUF4238 domain-containing protein n=1 Tax=Pantoea vagans TaxID=470934 RepID=UPI0002EAC1E2|nr:DUF4238 domain-containing protein [Pantoea vagans]